MTILHGSGVALSRLIAIGLLVSACSDARPPAENPDTLASAPPDSGTAPAPPSPGAEVFDREIVFLSTEADSVVAIPWFFRSSSTAEGIAREETVFLSRNGTWELLAENRADYPPSRSPWRIVPGDRTGLVIGIEDRIETLVFRDPPRELEVSLGNLMTEWARPGASSVRLHEATAAFPSGVVEGIVLDINRRWEVDDELRNAPGDWIFVRADPTFQLFLEERVSVPDPIFPRSYGGWTRLAFRDRPWEAVEATWSELRPFEPARRDVPVRWSLESPDGSLEGELEAVDSYLETGSDDGPILPVSGMIAVTGVISVDAEEFEVSGLVHHVQR